MLKKSNNNLVSRKRNQFEMYSLEDLVPKNHLVRKLDKVLDLSFIYDEVSDKYSDDNGRPSLDPIILFKIVIIQKVFGIKSMRQTIKEIETNFAYKWYLGLGVQDSVPHFSTFGKNYSRRFKDNMIFEKLFAEILKIAINNNLVDTSILFADSTHIKANANKNKYFEEMVKVEVKNYQEELDTEIGLIREKEGKKPLKNVNKEVFKKSKKSKTDPDAGYFVKGEKEKQFAYSAHATSDKFGWIVDIFVTPGNIHDSTQLKSVINNLDTKSMLPRYLAVDAGYKTPYNAKLLLDNEIVPLMPYTRPRGNKNKLRKNDFKYEKNLDHYICPKGQILNYKTTNREGYRMYHSDTSICKNCPLLSQCTESAKHEKVIARHIWENNIEIVNEIRLIDSMNAKYKMRSQTIERRFGDAKEQHGMRWTKYKGLGKVTMDTLLTFACMNLKKLANFLVA